MLCIYIYIYIYYRTNQTETLGRATALEVNRVGKVVEGGLFKRVSRVECTRPFLCSSGRPCESERQRVRRHTVCLSAYSRQTSTDP